MADLAAVDRIKLIEKKKESDTLPVAASTGVGIPCYVDSNGKAAIADANVVGATKVIGINRSEKSTMANMPAELLRASKVALFDSSANNILAGMAYGDMVFLSATAGRLADADPGTNEKQTLEITGTPTGGTFTLTFNGQTTAAIAFNATAATVQAALELLSTIRAGNVRCSGGALPGATVIIEFIQELGKAPQNAMTADISSLTGGAPAYTITETVAGVASVPVGRVMPLWDNTTAPTKILDFDLE